MIHNMGPSTEPCGTPRSTGLLSSPFFPLYIIHLSLTYVRMTPTRYAGTPKYCRASTILAQGMALKAFVTSRETAHATPFHRVHLVEQAYRPVRGRRLQPTAGSADDLLSAIRPISLSAMSGDRRPPLGIW